VKLDIKSLRMRSLLAMIAAAPSVVVEMDQTERARMADIKRRTPFHLQTGHRSRVFVSDGKVLTPATDAEIEELRAYEQRKYVEGLP
jgi:hypothetical protein